jgi:excisionase family DNA binding protein
MRKITANQDVMTTREAGEVLGVAVRTVQLWVESGVLPAWRTAGGHRRVSRTAVLQLLADRKHDLAVQPTSPVTSAQPPLRMLLVEDDPNLMSLFTALVRTWTIPLELTTASNGFEGLVRIGETQPDIVLTDLMMPGMDGFAMVRSLKKPGSGFSSLTILVASALSPEEIAEHGGLPDGVAYFQKPLNYVHLQTLLLKIDQDRLNKLKKSALAG